MRGGTRDLPPSVLFVVSTPTGDGTGVGPELKGSRKARRVYRWRAVARSDDRNLGCVLLWAETYTIYHVFKYAKP